MSVEQEEQSVEQVQSFGTRVPGLRDDDWSFEVDQPGDGSEPVDDSLVLDFAALTEEEQQEFAEWAGQDQLDLLLGVSSSEEDEEEPDEPGTDQTTEDMVSGEAEGSEAE